MLSLNWHITIGNFQLGLLDSVKIHASVDLLAATAEITLPATTRNRTLSIQDKINRGDAVTIQLGYNSRLHTEFCGYLSEIAVSDSGITLKCEDDIFLTRKPLPGRELKNASLQTILRYLVDTAALPFTIRCDYPFTYDKFVIHNTTTFDVLKKIQEETAANIYIRDKVLHLHPAAKQTFGHVTYDFAENIEKQNLTYKNASRAKHLVEIQAKSNNGQNLKIQAGDPGGDKKTINLEGVSDPSSLRFRAREELKRLSFDGYEGDFTTWLLPLCQPGFTAQINDSQNPVHNATYYINAVTTTFSQSGGSRKIQPGIKTN